MMNALRTVAAVLAAVVLLAAPASADTTLTALAPGDVLDVQVYGESTLSQTVTVAPDGSIALPLVGRLAVSGMSTAAAGAAITRGLSRYLREPLVTVALKSQAPYDVLVLGNVKTPGRYLLPPGSRLSDALAAAGGLNPTPGALPVAHVTDGDDATDVSLDALLRHGDLTQNPLVHSGTGVYIAGPSTFRVRVLGAVDHPGDVELNEGDRLAVAIAKAGDSPSLNADLNHIHVTHHLADGRTTVTEVNLYKSLEKGDTTSDLPLASDDVVFVPQAPKSQIDGGGILGVLRRIFLPF